MGVSGSHQRAGVHSPDRAGEVTEAYMVNRDSNVFPAILGRTCDRPCEPACRRGRLDGPQGKPVAICRLKRVAADLRGEISHLLPTIPPQSNGKRVASSALDLPH